MFGVNTTDPDAAAREQLFGLLRQGAADSKAPNRLLEDLDSSDSEFESESESEESLEDDVKVAALWTVGTS